MIFPRVSITLGYHQCIELLMLLHMKRLCIYLYELLVTLLFGGRSADWYFLSSLFIFHTPTFSAIYFLLNIRRGEKFYMYVPPLPAFLLIRAAGISILVSRSITCFLVPPCLSESQLLSHAELIYRAIGRERSPLLSYDLATTLPQFIFYRRLSLWYLIGECYIFVSFSSAGFSLMLRLSFRLRRRFCC